MIIEFAKEIAVNLKKYIATAVLFFLSLLVVTEIIEFLAGIVADKIESLINFLLKRSLK
jgi:hypothetical protein